jgi:cellulose synthase/poly-beta-1,6-N-acetylglucosamine synthase-like glycosyltransferase
MTPYVVVNLLVLALCGAVLAGFVLYLPLLWVAARRRPARRPAPDARLPALSVLVAVRNGADYIERKIDNALALDYPPDRLQVVVVSDGSTDGTASILQARERERDREKPRLKCVVCEEHVGKAEALNRGMRECTGEIVTFSDADALLEPAALSALAAHFGDWGVGGVCGQRVIAGEGRGLRHAQRRYVGFDSAIKALESRTGRITSNDGKLYAIRRDLFRPIPGGVTDDLYVAMAVISQGRDFLFEPAARASVRLPSRNAAHEVARRRRIVARSLRGIREMRRLLDPRRHGTFALGLFANKVLRRLLPVCLILAFASTAALSPFHPAAASFLALQAAFYVAALCHPLLQRVAGNRGLSRAASVPFYICVGAWGTLLGLADFLRGRIVSRWDPVKADS